MFPLRARAYSSLCAFLCVCLFRDERRQESLPLCSRKAQHKLDSVYFLPVPFVKY